MSSKISQICLIFLIFHSQTERDGVHLSIILHLDCLNSVIWPFILTAFTLGSCLYCANISHYKDGWAVNFKTFSQRDNRTSKLNTSIRAQHNHEPPNSHFFEIQYLASRSGFVMDDWTLYKQLTLYMYVYICACITCVICGCLLVFKCGWMLE